MGYLPGTYDPVKTFDFYQQILTPNLRTYLTVRGLQIKLNVSMDDCYSSALCQSFLKKGLALIEFKKLFYHLRNSNEDFLIERPDFYLGRFFYMFADIVLASNYGLYCPEHSSNNETNPILNRMIVDFFTQGFWLISFYDGSCRNTKQILLQSHYEIFMDVVLYSQIGFDGKIGNSKLDFKNKYANMSFIFYLTKPEEPKFLINQLGMIPFCEFAHILNLTGISESENSRCNRFHPFLTTSGLCQTFNSLGMNQIFKNSTFLHSWMNLLNIDLNLDPINSVGSGPSNGFYFVLNSFERVKASRDSNNFIMSITNEFNPFDIFEQNYPIETGHFYTFRVLANQVVTTDKFDLLHLSQRNCSLPNENGKLNLVQNYSKSGCKYECYIKQAIQECQCISWSIPPMVGQQLSYCSLYENDCFDQAMKSKLKESCNCPEDCYGTSFSVFPSVKDLEIPKNFCSDQKIKDEFPFPIFCSLCKNVIKTHRMRFYYDHVINGASNPDDLDEFCHKFIHENVAVVKIEMATKFITRSVKDRRNSFVSQLSSIGKQII